MKIQPFVITTALLGAAATTSAYTVGFGLGRPLIVRGLYNRNKADCSGPNCNDGFDALRNEFGSPRRRRARRFVESNSPSLDRQRDMIRKAFDLATEFMDETTNTNRDSADFIDRAFGVVNDMSAGRASPRYEVSNEEEAFLLAIDVPGIDASDLDLEVNQDEQTLTIAGKRTVGRGENARTSEFSKTFTLDDSAMLEDISAKLENGVLAVTVPKQAAKPKEDFITKVPITVAQGDDDNIEPVVEAKTESPDASEATDVNVDESKGEPDSE